MSELVLSNTTTFFLGKIENLFRKAKKYGFRYVEIVPYRWITPEQILKLQKKYAVQVAGIHLPVIWNGIDWRFWGLVFQAYLGPAINSPGLTLAEALAKQNPYVLIHTNVVSEMGPEKFAELCSRFQVAVENVVYDPFLPENLWNPAKISHPRRVFDHGHLLQSKLALSGLDIKDIYRKAAPDVFHISYNSRLNHLLPNREEQAELRTLLAIHKPRYIVIETNPLVSVKKGKLLLEKILNPPF